MKSLTEHLLIRNLTLSGMALLVTVITGCASVPMASEQRDSQAKTFIPPENTGSVYIYRNEMLGAAIPITMSINGMTIGQTAANTYFHFNLAPGIYNIDSLSHDRSHIQLNIAARKNYFVWQEIKVGPIGSPGTHLQEVSESEGRQAVTELKMIASPIPDAELSQSAAPVTHTAAKGSPVAKHIPSLGKKLSDLLALKEEGVITIDEYNQKRDELSNMAH